MARQTCFCFGMCVKGGWWYLLVGRESGDELMALCHFVGWGVDIVGR